MSCRVEISSRTVLVALSVSTHNPNLSPPAQQCRAQHSKSTRPKNPYERRLHCLGEARDTSPLIFRRSCFKILLIGNNPSNPFEQRSADGMWHFPPGDDKSIEYFLAITWFDYLPLHIIPLISVNDHLDTYTVILDFRISPLPE
jgi:hypothetical protein